MKVILSIILFITTITGFLIIFENFKSMKMQGIIIGSVIMTFSLIGLILTFF